MSSLVTGTRVVHGQDKSGARPCSSMRKIVSAWLLLKEARQDERQISSGRARQGSHGEAHGELVRRLAEREVHQATARLIADFRRDFSHPVFRPFLVYACLHAALNASLLFLNLGGINRLCFFRFAPSPARARFAFAMVQPRAFLFFLSARRATPVTARFEPCTLRARADCSVPPGCST